jgi:uncharacterized protein with FMN-binding domain
MRRALFALAGTVAGLVLLLSFKTQATTVAAPPAALSTPAPESGGTATAGAGTKTVTGDAAETRYGPVQVQVTVTNGAVTAVTAVDYPQDNPRDSEINSYAIPQLDQEATAAKSASIDFVSGATYTSEGYVQSLQSALDKAGL